MEKPRRDFKLGKSLREIWNSLLVGDCVTADILEELLIEHAAGNVIPGDFRKPLKSDRKSLPMGSRRINNWLINTSRGKQIVSERLHKGTYQKLMDYKNLKRLPRVKKSGSTTAVGDGTISLLEVGQAIVLNIAALKESNTELVGYNKSLTDQLKDATVMVSLLRVQVVELKEEICSGKSGGSVPIDDLTTSTKDLGRKV